METKIVECSSCGTWYEVREKDGKMITREISEEEAKERGIDDVSDLHQVKVCLACSLQQAD